MKNTKLFLHMLEVSLKERYLIYLEGEPPKKEAVKLSPEEKEALEAGDQLYNFLAKNEKDLIAMSEPYKSEKGYIIKTEGYKIFFYEDSITTGIMVVHTKGTLVLQGGYGKYSLFWADKNSKSKSGIMASVSKYESGTNKRPQLLKEKFEKFHGVLKRALEKYLREKPRDEQNKVKR